MPDIDTDILIVGAGGAGMYAALSAVRNGAERVLLADKSLVGRGGATVMAQMTVAAALAEESDDGTELHLADTLEAGRGLCVEPLAAALCEDAPVRIREMEEWRVGWARRDTGRIAQVTAPGHSRPRCCYVDFLNTGPAVAATLRRRVAQVAAIRRVSNLAITDLVTAGGEIAGAVGLDLSEGHAVTIGAKAVIIATGGLTRLYRRSSASANMGGDGFALALGAGAELVDMEFVQFFPIGHLAPRLVGMDPIMWDPFRYKLGGRLLDGDGHEFLARYGSDKAGTYTTPRDIATYAITKEVAAGRGSPHGGVYLSFEHVPRAALEAAFGPVIDRLARNGIDLAKAPPVEVSPIAHYHMGGIVVDARMASRVPGLYAAGEAAGGANGANRLSGNAIPEALGFGERAGRFAAEYAESRKAPPWPHRGGGVEHIARLAEGRRGDVGPTELLDALRTVMQDDVGPFRDAAGLARAVARLRDMRGQLAALAVPAGTICNPGLADWFELRASLAAAEAVAVAALSRTESRGAHQRDDFPLTDPAWARNQRLVLASDGRVVVT